MFKQIFKSIYRNLLKDKVFSLINIANLIVGFAAFILLSLIAFQELSWDKYNKNYDRIYRVQTLQEDAEEENYNTYSPPAYRYRLMEDIPEVEEVLIMHEILGQYFTSANNDQLFDKKGYYSENTVFSIFTYDFIEGNTETALTEPNTIVLSKELADKIFPEGNALGKQLMVNKRLPLRVDGIYTDLSKNSSIRPSYLISMSTFETTEAREGFRDNWTSINNDNIVLLKNGTSMEAVNAKIKNAFQHVKGFEKSTPYLHPISKWHISPNSQIDLYIAISILSLAALLILVLSCTNFVNLTLANTSGRAREIGIKKVVGFSKRSVATQFLIETLTITFFSAILGIILVQALIPKVNSLLQIHLEFNLFRNLQLLSVLIGVSLLAGLIAGSYPAFIISSFNPVKVLKGKIFNPAIKKLSIKKVLVVTQFSISLFMLIVSIVLYSQVNFMLNKNLGFDKDHLLYTEINATKPVAFETIRNRLRKYPEIADVTFSNTIPFNGNIGGFVGWEGSLPDQKVMVSRNYVNYDFISTYDLQMKYGRNFSKEFATDNQGCIINETALKIFGWEEPIGKYITLYDVKYPVIGVVEDFHPFSVNNLIPTYIMFLNSNILSGASKITLRYTEGNGQKAQQLANSEFEELLPYDPVDFRFYDNNIFADFAINFWMMLKRIFQFFAATTLFIASIGLFGLILYTTKRRVKEIGVRKILGSSVSKIFNQLAVEILGLLFFAVLIACPAAYLVHKYMPGAYKESLTFWDFLFAILVVGIIALLTISSQILKVARNNPSEALRYE